MTKRIFANRFGLIALLGLFTSTAFAGNSPAPTQVVVTNTPAQPVPIVGLIKDSDAPARKPFVTNFTQVVAGAGQVNDTVLGSVLANQRLVVEHVSGYCTGVSNGGIWLDEEDAASNGIHGEEFLPGDILVKMISVPIRFYVDPGNNLKLHLSNLGGQSGYCTVSVSGYFVNLP